MLFAVLVTTVTSAGCAAPRNAANSTTSRPALLHQIAADYAQDSNLDRAKAALAKLNLANPGQVVLLQAEQEARENGERDGIQQLADLAGALGARSQQLLVFLEPPTAAPVAVAQAPAQPQVPAPAPATATPAATQALATAIAVASPTNEATAMAQPSSTPARPHVTAPGTANLRSGPGTTYPVIGQMAAGQVLAIMARNAGGDWWRVAYPSEEQAWVSSQVVEVTGGDGVAVAQNIPAPPPTAVPAATRPAQPAQAPQPAPAPTAAPRPSVQYVVKDLHLRHVGVDAQSCGSGGDHNIWVYVIDPAGNRLDGVRVREIFTNSIHPTGSQGKGPGTALWDIYRGGGGQVDIVDEGGNRISDLSRGMSDDWPDADLLWEAGYCGCKPYPDLASCQAGVEAKEYSHFPIGHYVFEVTFQRTY